METKTSLSILECIENVYKHSKDSHLREAFFKAVEKETKILSNYLQVGKMEAVLFAVAFAVWYDRNSFVKVFRHFDMDEFLVMKYRKEIQNLYRKNLLVNKDKWGKKINEYYISQTVIVCVSENSPIKIVENKEVEDLNLVDILEKFDSMSDMFDDKEISGWEFRESIDEMCNEFQERPLFKKIKELKLNNFETYFLLDTIWDAVKRGDNDFNTNVQRTVEDYYDRRGLSMETLSSIVKGETFLTTKKLIELSKEQYINRTEAKLSAEMIKFLKENENLIIDNITEENKKLLQHKNLPKRELFYSESERKQIDDLGEMLSGRKFTALQKRLKSRNMPFGVAVLLHGAPGTGKTESVYQLAKRTGRNIFKVDISETKSMWFGESQKLTKKIFSQYREMCETEKRTPILLFNEADAIIGKRKSAGSSNVADTENAIQNIILEEMENFEGIMFATTNLVENMDSAFERRFLFKIKFEKPKAEISAKIWQLKLPFLNENEALKLAERFDFSGGEMENISRKILMDELVSGEKPCYAKVLELCENEKWAAKDGKKIGF